MSRFRCETDIAAAANSGTKNDRERISTCASSKRRARGIKIQL